MRDRHARLSHGSVNGSPSTAAAETKTRNCRLGRGASARARHCCAGRRSCAGYRWSEGWRRGWHDPPTVGFFDPPIEPARGAAAATRPVPSPRPDRQRRVQLDRCLRVRTASLSWKVGSRARASTVVIIQSSPSTGWRPPSSEVAAFGQCLETSIHHMAREPIRSTTEVARVTLRHTSGANTWRYPAPGWDTSISRSVSGGWNATAICVIGDATVMWTSAGTARSGWLKPRRRSRSPVRPVGTGKIWPASGGRSRGPAPAAIRGL